MSVTLGTLTVIFATPKIVTTAAGEYQPVLHGAQGPIGLVAANAFVLKWARETKGMEMEEMQSDRVAV